MELVNAIRKTVDTGPGASDAAVREAVEAVAISMSIFAPYTAEDMWQRLGHGGSTKNDLIAFAGWRKADPLLLVEESVTAIVQVDGKVRDKLEVSPTISSTELEALARASESVVRAIADRPIAQVIVRAPRIVNIATVK
jgi:leucyl-tRNA synthetase